MSKKSSRHSKRSPRTRRAGTPTPGCPEQPLYPGLTPERLQLAAHQVAPELIAGAQKAKALVAGGHSSHAAFAAYWRVSASEVT